MEPSSSTSLLCNLNGIQPQITTDIASLETVCEDQETTANARLLMTGKCYILVSIFIFYLNSI